MNSAQSGATDLGAREMVEPITASPVKKWDLFEELETTEHEKVVICHEPSVGLRAVICIHSTLLGPANGGVRMYPYPSTEEAVRDGLRLSRAMTYKWSAAGENRGGGKAVIIGDPATAKSEALLRAFGRFVDQLRGEYYVGEDVGINLDDMQTIHLETDYVATLPVEAGGLGDIAPQTASGVLYAMRACAERVWGTRDLAGRTVALQGLGACGSAALGQLLEAGAKAVVTDLDQNRVEAAVRKFGVEAVEPAEIYEAAVDIFAPFAMGGVINADTVPRLRAKVVAGSANNMFAEEGDALALEERGIVYAPDFIANAGGAIFDAEQFRKGGFNAERVGKRLALIEDRVKEVFEIAKRDGITCQAAAHVLAERRLSALWQLRSKHG
jgi:leucine dehydrogenase